MSKPALLIEGWITLGIARLYEELMANAGDRCAGLQDRRWRFCDIGIPPDQTSPNCSDRPRANVGNCAPHLQDPCNRAAMLLQGQESDAPTLFT